MSIDPSYKTICINQASPLEFLKGKLSHIPILGNIVTRMQIKKVEKEDKLLNRALEHVKNNKYQLAEKCFLKYEKYGRKKIEHYEKARYEKVSLELGYSYLFGNSVEKNLDKAIDSFGKAGSLRSGLADKIYSWKNRGLDSQEKYFYLAEIFIDNIFSDTKPALKEKYMKEAVSYYEIAGSLGCIEAYLRLSPIYLYKMGELEKRIECLEKATELGSPIAKFILKSPLLGEIYTADLYFKKREFQQAINYYEKAAEKFHPQACMRLFEIYSQGIEGQIAVNPDLAKKYLEKYIACDKTIPYIDEDMVSSS
ncbi:MAG: hypothetical protein M3A24_00645 [Candidatus Rhabdochlamydia oedothoracis]|nr:hypothetical protein [Candidatus Rhabdochlamydia oedothoracis]